jgi:hypothetical protein
MEDKIHEHDISVPSVPCTKENTDACYECTEQFYIKSVEYKSENFLYDPTPGAKAQIESSFDLHGDRISNSTANRAIAHFVDSKTINSPSYDPKQKGAVLDT